MKAVILFPRNASIPFNTSAAALSGVVRQGGFDCAAYPIDDGRAIDSVIDDVVRLEPDVICATLMTRDILGFRSLFARLRKHTAAFTAVGGYHATIRPRHVAQWEGVDSVGIGEGERALLALLQSGARKQAIGTMPGLWVRSAQGFVDPIPPANVEPDMTQLPPWDYSVTPEPGFKGEAGRYFLVSRTSRACPFACTYCSVPAWEATNGLRNRSFVNVRPVAHLCDELADLRDRYSPTDIEFWDPQFPFANEWLADLAELFPARVGLPFRALMHVKTLNEQRIDLLAKAGCTQLYFGLESGDEEFRRTVLNKSCSDGDIVRTVGRVKAAGISPCAFVMWNLPGETREQAQRTIEMIDRTGFDRVRVNCYIPLPGTVLGEQATLEFPDEAVDVFGPLPEWRHGGDKNRSAMSDDEYLRMRAEFAELQNRYVEKGYVPGVPDDATRTNRYADEGIPESAGAPIAEGRRADRLPAERLRKLSDLLAVETASSHPHAFHLRDAFLGGEQLVLVLGMPDDDDRQVIVQPIHANNPCYARTEHCLISYQGSTLSGSLREVLDHIRRRIENVPFENL